MLKASLPFYRKKEQNLPQNPQNEAIEGLNLLGARPEFLPSQSRFKFIRFLQTSIAVICVIFLLMTAVNFFLDLRLANLKDKVDKSFAEVMVFEKEAVLARSIDRKTLFYKEILDSRNSVGDKMEVLFGNLGGTMSALESKLDSENFRIKVEGNTPLDFAKLLNTYLETGKIDRIVIKSADLQRGKRTYIVEFEGVFK